ncbi:MAG: MarR family transcriptional regulator [Stecheria intestinalis]|nr:MarR family transcriptional regulator [Stecheria intestinalis]
MSENLRLDHQLCFPLYACARKVTSLYTPYFKELDLTYTQYIIFLVLWEQDGISVSQLGEKLYLDSGTLTPLLKKMETKGWIRRTRSEEDERVVMITLTKKGKELEKQADEIPEKVGSCIPLKPEEARELYRLLYQILETGDECHE